MISRRSFLVSSAVGAAVLVARRRLDAVPVSVVRPTLVVHRDPGCGCCLEWVKRVEAAGYPTVVHDEADMDAIKDHYLVPSGVRSCHTALAGSYVIEGHVPAADIDRLLREKPAVLGLAVPGMVTGSPGMEGGTPRPYATLAFQKSGATTVFAKH